MCARINCSVMRRNLPKRFYSSNQTTKIKPKASEVLTGYLKQTCEPPWTSYFVKYRDVINDQYGMSHFNWQVGQSNYTVLRVGCFPFIKYHCTKSPKRDLDLEDKFFRFIKVANLGIPCFLYGVAALFLIQHKELVHNTEYFVYLGEALIEFEKVAMRRMTLDYLFKYIYENMKV